jgi:hypothetical protein
VINTLYPWNRKGPLHTIHWVFYGLICSGNGRIKQGTI